jgi:hypothetical protein
MKVGDLVENQLFWIVGQPRIGVLVDRAVKWIGDELQEGKEWFVSWDTGEVSSWPIQQLKVLNDLSE